MNTASVFNHHMNRFFKIILSVYLLVQGSSAFGQRNDYDIKFFLPGGKGTTAKSYMLRAVSYSTSSDSRKDSLEGSSYNQYRFSVSIDVQDLVDKDFFEWSARESLNEVGKVEVRDRRSGDLVRSLEFSGIVSNHASETLTSDGAYSFPSASVTIYTDRLVVDGVDLSAGKK